MSAETEFVTLPFISGKSVYSILRTSLLAGVLSTLIWIYWSRRRLVNVVNKLPSWKLRFYHVLGHVHLVLYVRLIVKRSLVHIYDFLMLQGYLHVFRKEGIANIWQVHHPFVAVFKADFVEVILNHSTELEKAWFYHFLHPWLGTGLLTSHDAKWKNRRKLLTPAFHFNILKDFLPVFNKQSKILVEILEKHTTDEYVNIVPFVTNCSLDIICESILGAEMHTQTKPTSQYVKSVTALTSGTFERMQSPWLWPNFVFKLSPSGRKFYRDLKVVHDFTYKLINEKKRQKLVNRDSENSSANPVQESEFIYTRNKRALLDLLLDEHIKDNSLSEKDIREEVDTFTFEGHDTTSMGMSWSLYLIGLHPHVQAKVHAELDSIFGEDDREATADDLKEMKYLECVFKEALRLYPSVPAFGRRINEEVQFGDRIVPKGSTCVVFTYLLHRDPDAFPNPEKFEPERFTPENSIGRHPFAYVPFSAGPRNCIGQRFALMEEKVVVSSILRKFRVRSLDPRDKVQVVDEIVLRPAENLRIEIRPRKEGIVDTEASYYA